MPKAQAKPTSYRNRIILLFAAGLFLYVVLPQIGAFKSSFTIARQADPLLITLALACSGLTYIAATNTYYLLALKKLRYLRTVLAQLASMFVNRLLPAGIGSIGANYVYLRKSKHSVSEAASVVTANNFIGLIGHLILSVVLLILFSDQLPNIHVSNLTKNLPIILMGSALGVLILFVIAKKNSTFKARLNDTILQLVAYKHHPLKILSALISSISLTLFSIACLYFCMLSLDVNLSFVVVMLIFTLGVAAGTVTPTPGGLGGVEAGLIAGFIAAGVSAPTAFAIALTYRFIHYWISLVTGGIAFIACRRRGYM